MNTWRLKLLNESEFMDSSTFMRGQLSAERATAIRFDYGIEITGYLSWNDKPSTILYPWHTIQWFAFEN